MRKRRPARDTRGSGHASQPQEQQQEQQEQQPHAAAAAGQQATAAAVKRRDSRRQPRPMECLSNEALQAIFLRLAEQDQQGYCREILPLVCKRFRDVLEEPCGVWETLHIDFIQKGLDLAYPALRAAAPDDGGEPGGTNRRLLHSMVERWVKPRAASVKRLVVSFSARDSTHSFPKGGHGLRRTFQLLAPSLQELCIAHCSDIFHAKSFADLAQLQRLETLAVTFMTGRLAPADLAPLEGLRRLRTLTLSASRDAEEAGEACLHAFPDSLLRLRGLTSLGLCSMGVTNLPAGITRLKQLACLDVSGCPLTFLPSQMWKLGSLRHLRLNDTCLMVGLSHTWEPLAKLPALESLELRDVKASSLPPTLTGLTALTSLDLSDNAFDSTLPGLEDSLAGLASLPHLQRLVLRSCQLPSVPEQVCGASALTHLDLSRNQLVELPPGLSGLGRLRQLVAEGNCFPRIPQVLAQLPAIEDVDLSFNIYMEAALSQRPLLADGGLLRLRRLDLRKMLGVWKASSTRWLRDLVAALEERHLAGRGSPGSCPLVLWDEGEAQGGA